MFNPLRNFPTFINNKFKDTPPAKIIFCTAVATVAIPHLYSLCRKPWSHYIWNTSWKDRNWKKTCAAMGYEAGKKIPIVKQYLEKTIDKEVEKYTAEFIQERNCVFSKGSKNPLPFNKKRLTFDEIRENVPKIDHEKNQIDEQKISGVYYGAEIEEEIERFLDQFIAEYDHENILHASLVPVLGKMQRDVVAWLGEILSLEQPYGCLTSGGTESLLLAAKSAVNWGKKNGINEPNILMPYSGHSAFNKAEDYFRCEVRKIPLTTEGEVDINAMKRAIDQNTVMLMGSYPNYPYGTVDDIKSIAQLAQKKRLLCHVDACLGGFVAGFLQNDEDSNVAPF